MRVSDNHTQRWASKNKQSAGSVENIRGTPPSVFQQAQTGFRRVDGWGGASFIFLDPSLLEAPNGQRVLTRLSFHFLTRWTFKTKSVS